MHLSLLGEDGLRKLAELNHGLAARFAEMLGEVPGCRVVNDSFFNEFTVELPLPAADLVEKMASVPMLAGVAASRLYPERPELENLLLVAVTELNRVEDMQAYVDLLKRYL